MRANYHVLTTIAFLMTLAVPAFAQEAVVDPVAAPVTLSADAKVSTGYLLGDIGATASDKPVVQFDLLANRGKFTAGLWASVGEDRYAKEVDFLSFFNTHAGPVLIEVSGQWYFLNGPRGVLNMDNGVGEVYLDARLPLTIGKITIAPVGRVVRMWGVKTFPDLTLVQLGPAVSFTSGKLSMSAEARDSFNRTQHYSNWRLDGVIAYKLSDKLTVKALYQRYDLNNAAQPQRDQVFSLGFTRSF